MSAITTHILDTALGKPACGVAVTLTRISETGEPLKTYRGTTNDDGRVVDLLGDDSVETGCYQISFDTAGYAASKGTRPFYPRVDISFYVEDEEQHYHVPLLLSPFGYQTYRGS